MKTRTPIHDHIDKMFSDIRELQKALVILGLPEYWPDKRGGQDDQGDHAKAEDPTPPFSGSTTSVREAIMELLRDKEHLLSVDDFDNALKGSALSHEMDKRIRRRKISQALYALRDDIKAVKGPGGRVGHKYGLPEWFDGDKPMVAHR